MPVGERNDGTPSVHDRQMLLLGPRCPVCHRTVSADCAGCWSAALDAPVDSVVPAAVAFVGAGRRLVLGLKYANGRTLARPLAARMAPLVAGDRVDLVTWAPTSSGRVRRRGYDQAELIARALADELGVPCRRMLRRLGRSGPQTGRSRDQRLGGPRFVARRRFDAPSVVLVDDVVTTGATLAAAERALLRAGCALVRPVAAAATP